MNDLFEFDVCDSNETYDIKQFMTANDNAPQSPQQPPPEAPDQITLIEKDSLSTVQSPIAGSMPAPFKKSKWTPEEDRLLIDSVKSHGMGNWSLVSQAVPGRTGKQCRERWINQLCPALNKDNWTPQEDAILIQQQRIHGNFWSKIAQFLPGRSSNNVKNRWSWLSRHRVPPSLAAQMMPYIVQQQQMQQHIQQQQQLQQQQMQAQIQQQMLQMHQQFQQPPPSANVKVPQSVQFPPQSQQPQQQFNQQRNIMQQQQKHAKIQLQQQQQQQQQQQSPVPSMYASQQTAPPELQWGMPQPMQMPQFKDRIAFSDPYGNVNISAPTSLGNQFSAGGPDSVLSFGEENIFSLPGDDENDVFGNSSLTDMPIAPPDDIFKTFEDWGTY